jgi:hypothetical protein
MEQTSEPRRLLSRRGIIVIAVLVLILLAALALVFSFPGFDVWSQDYIQTVVPRL